MQGLRMNKKADALLTEIRSLDAKLNELIEQCTDEAVKDSPGVPRGIVRGIITRNDRCNCSVARRLLDEGPK
jgi:hypothetical protein